MCRCFFGAVKFCLFDLFSCFVHCFKLYFSYLVFFVFFPFLLPFPWCSLFLQVAFVVFGAFLSMSYELKYTDIRLLTKQITAHISNYLKSEQHNKRKYNKDNEGKCLQK